MDIVQKIALMGGLFAAFSFIHFFVDWVFQSHAEAMAKHNNAKVRAKHCLIYTIGFIPLLLLLHFSFLELLLSLNILFWSHFYLDTYHLVFLWAKYIRRPPEMVEPWKETCVMENGIKYVKLHQPDAKKRFCRICTDNFR